MLSLLSSRHRRATALVTACAVVGVGAGAGAAAPAQARPHPKLSSCRDGYRDFVYHGKRSDLTCGRATGTYVLEGRTYRLRHGVCVKTKVNRSLSALSVFFGATIGTQRLTPGFSHFTLLITKRVHERASASILASVDGKDRTPHGQEFINATGAGNAGSFGRRSQSAHGSWSCHGQFFGL